MASNDAWWVGQSFRAPVALPPGAVRGVAHNRPRVTARTARYLWHGWSKPRFVVPGRSWFTAVLLTSGCFGGAVDQTTECTQYVRCIEAVDTLAGQTSNLDRYEIGGACWGNSEIADLCTTSCTRALARIHELVPAPPTECVP